MRISNRSDIPAVVLFARFSKKQQQKTERVHVVCDVNLCTHVHVCVHVFGCVCVCAHVGMHVCVHECVLDRSW